MGFFREFLEGESDGSDGSNGSGGVGLYCFDGFFKGDTMGDAAT